MVKQPKLKPVQVGPVKATPPEETSTRMAIFLWGPATVGKTTFAATAPGNKLWLSFGDEEHKSIMHRKDVLISNLSGLNLDDLFKHAQNDDPFGLDKILAEREDIATVVWDSATAVTFRALQKSVRAGVGKSNTFTPTMLAPGRSAYGGRNAVVLECLTGLLRVTARHNVHCIITAHEADPTTKTDERGNEVIEYISVMLGGQLVNNITYRLSEIWHLSQSAIGDKERRLAVRPTMNRKPMKTRMFDGKGDPMFKLRYDAEKPDDARGQMTIAGFYDQWVAGGFQKLQVPK